MDDNAFYKEIQGDNDATKLISDEKMYQIHIFHDNNPYHSYLHHQKAMKLL
jgi:hypothetical protein